MSSLLGSSPVPFLWGFVDTELRVPLGAWSYLVFYGFFFHASYVSTYASSYVFSYVCALGGPVVATNELCRVACIVEDIFLVICLMVLVIFALVPAGCIGVLSLQLLHWQ